MILVMLDWYLEVAVFCPGLKIPKVVVWNSEVQHVDVPLVLLISSQMHICVAGTYLMDFSSTINSKKYVSESQDPKTVEFC